MSGVHARRDRLYFMREAEGDYTILQSRFENGRWSAPNVAPFSGAYMDIDPFVALDGSQVIFGSRRPAPGSDSVLNVFQLWSVPLTGSTAGIPAPYGPPWDLSVSRFFATSTSDGTLYFSQREVGGTTGNDLYRSRRVAGVYQAPEALAELNTRFSDSNPLIAPDGGFIIFFSTRPGGLGNSDLYFSRPDGESWTPPQNLGPLVNTADFENCPALSPDGEYLFFSRGHRNEAGELTSRNVYFVELQAVISSVEGGG